LSDKDVAKLACRHTLRNVSFEGITSAGTLMKTFTPEILAERAGVSLAAADRVLNKPGAVFSRIDRL